MEPDQFASLLDLPNEVLEKIVSYLPAVAVHKNLRLTCKRLHDFCNSERFCRHEVIVWSEKSEPHMISTFCNSTRGSYNLVFISVNLKYELVSTFFEQHGAKVRSLAFKRCKSPPGLLETIITHCDALCSLSIEGFHRCTFSSIDPEMVTRPTVTSLKLKIDAIMVRQLPSILLQISSIFPCVKHLNIELDPIYKSYVCRSFVPNILDFVMNFSHLESLELDTLLEELLKKEPKFLNSLSKLKKLCLSLNWRFYEALHLWEGFTSRLNVSSIELCRLDHADICVIEPVLRVTGLNHLRFRSVNTLHFNLNIFETLVSSQLKMIKLEANKLLIYEELTEDVLVEINRTVTDLIIQSEPFNGFKHTFLMLMTLFPTYFHGLVYLKMGTVSDEVIQSIFKYQKNLRSLVLVDCKDCTVAGFCGTVNKSSRNSITNLQNLEHLSIQQVKEEVIQSKNFQTAFDFSRLKYLQIIVWSGKINSPSLRKPEIPVKMFKTCANLEALELRNFTTPSFMIISSLFRNSKQLNYLSFYKLGPNVNLMYVNLKHFYSVDLEKLLVDYPNVFYYDSDLDRTVFTRRIGFTTARIHSPKVGSHEIRWISIN